MNYPVQTRELVRIRANSSGFTLIEILTALFVVGIATTVFIQLYTASLGLSRLSTHYNVAGQIAEEYMVELQANPQQFAWPNFDVQVGELQDIEQLDVDRQLIVDVPTAMPITQAAHDRVSNLYNDFTWKASARIHEEDSNFVEVLVTVTWVHRNRPQAFYLTSTVPRSVGEGIGL